MRTRRFVADRLIRSTLYICALLALVVSVASAQTPSWFTPSAGVRENWSLIYSLADPLRFELVQKNAPNNDPPYNILFAFPKRSSAYDTAVDRIAAQFVARDLSAKFTVVNFEGNQERGELLLREIDQKQYDLIFSVGSTSTKFITDHAQRINVPVVSVTSKDPVILGHVDDYQSGSGTNIAYTSLDIPTNVQIAYLRNLRPNLVNIGIMYARNNTSAYEAQVVPLREAISDSINVIEVVVEDQDNAAAELAEKIPQALSLMRADDPRLDNSIFWITGSTSVFREIEVINAHAQSVPVLSLVTDVVRAGRDSAVMSIGVGFSSNADLAAFYAISILTDQIDPGELPVGIVNPPDIAINFAVAKDIRLKIPFNFFESSSTIYGPDGQLRRKDGALVGN